MTFELYSATAGSVAWLLPPPQLLLLSFAEQRRQAIPLGLCSRWLTMGTPLPRPLAGVFMFLLWGNWAAACRGSFDAVNQICMSVVLPFLPFWGMLAKSYAAVPWLVATSGPSAA